MSQSFAANDNLIDRTCEVWEPRLGRDVSPDDARQSPRMSPVSLHPRRVEMLVPANEATEPPILAGKARHEQAVLFVNDMIETKLEDSPYGQ